MFWIFLVFLFLMLFTGIVNDKKSPFVVFTVIWAIIILLYSLQLYDIFIVSDYTKIVLCSGIFFFLFGYIINSLLWQYNNKICKGSNFNYDKDFDYFEELAPNTKIMKMLIILLFILSIPIIFERITFLFNNNFDFMYLKNALISGELTNASILRIFVVNPLSFLMTIFSSFFIVNNRKEKIVCFSGIFFTAVNFICDGSKITIIYLCIALLINLMMSRSNLYDTIDKFKKIKKHITIIVVVSIICIFLFIYSYEKTIFLKQIYYYICGSIPMLDKILNKDGVFGLFNRTFGTLSFYSIVKPVAYIFQLFGIDFLNKLTINASNALLAFELSNYAGIGVRYNAFTTFVSSFYIDFGLIGVILLSLIFGYFTSNIYRKAKKYRNFLYNSMLSLIYIYIVTSMVRFQFSNFKMGLTFVYLILLSPVFTKKEKD